MDEDESALSWGIRFHEVAPLFGEECMMRWLPCLSWCQCLEHYIIVMAIGDSLALLGAGVWSTTLLTWQ